MISYLLFLVENRWIRYVDEMDSLIRKLLMVDVSVWLFTKMEKKTHIPVDPIPKNNGIFLCFSALVAK